MTTTTKRLRTRRRQVSLVAGTALLTLGLAACGGVNIGDEEESAGGDGDASGESVTLELVGNSDFTDATTALADAYTAEHPEVQFDLSFAPVDQLQTALRTRLGAGNAPDLYAAWPGNGSSMSTAQLAGAGLMEPITGQEWLDNVPDTLRELLGYDGETYLWSAGVGVIGTFYNEGVFEDTGTEIPTTWTELLDTCDSLNAQGITPMSLGNQTPWVTQLISYAIAPSVAFGDDRGLAEEMLAGESTFSDSGWRQTLENYMAMEERGCFNDNANGTTVEQAISMLADGDAAMMVTVSALYSQIEEAADGRATFGVFPFPAAENADDLLIPGGINVGLAASPDGDHVDVATDFLAFAGEPEQMSAFATAGNLIPFGLEDPSELDPVLQPFAEYLAEDRTVPFMDQQWPNAEVQPTHFAVIQELFSGTSTIDEALQKLDEAYQG